MFVDFVFFEGWGIIWFFCIKFMLMDCFKEGGDFDYFEEMKLFERFVFDVGIIKNIIFIDFLFGLY